MHRRRSPLAADCACDVDDRRTAGVERRGGGALGIDEPCESRPEPEDKAPEVSDGMRDARVRPVDHPRKSVVRVEQEMLGLRISVAENAVDGDGGRSSERAGVDAGGSRVRARLLEELTGVWQRLEFDPGRWGRFVDRSKQRPHVCREARPRMSRGPPALAVGSVHESLPRVSAWRDEVDGWDVRGTRARLSYGRDDTRLGLDPFESARKLGSRKPEHEVLVDDPDPRLGAGKLSKRPDGKVREILAENLANLACRGSFDEGTAPSQSGSQPSRYRVGWRLGRRAYASAASLVSCSTLTPWRRAVSSTV